MSLRDAISALVTATPSGTLVPVDWLAAQLAADSGEQLDTPATGVIDLTVPAVAARFNRGSSTIRTWCERGHLPGAYRLNGREWRIPLTAVEALQRTAAKQHSPAKPSDLPKATDISAWRNHVPQTKRTA